MEKLSTADRKRRDDIEVRLRDSAETLKDEHQKLHEATAEFNRAIDAHNEIVNEASGFRDDIVAAIDEYIGGKSDRWREGDRAQAYESWKSEWENLDLDELEHLPEPDLPEGEHADQLMDAPVEPDAP